ncbi:Gfo/Idh/MocA family oxidoreductase [Sphingobacterium sp. N143]|uniref:Gfo/Idh/MocA family protein n=1 Tax=Sphingobacterium sp. N143 TaxID=2746727 RepID=UPI00257705D7|nr:Gfo/Idh/MocA family oxidoreductase [Sphingobacterium sp. N143]MDM1296277.1 Gfo/Idh/MocA family oxidoreductase [Sphingobacterium sp. N143]
MNNSRRDFIKKASLLGTSMYVGANAFSAASYRRIIGANDRINIGVIGFSDRHKGAHAPSFLAAYKELNFDIIAVSDIWKLRREEGANFWKQQLAHDIKPCVNNEELYAMKDVDAVFVSTADFQHAMHAIEAVRAGKDAYVEKPLAETMEDARAVLKAVADSKKIVQIGSQRRSGINYFAANDFIKSGKFGDIVMVELTWNVNQPGRWRRPELVARLREEDTDWKRFLLNRPYEPFNPRHYLEYRLFWPYSSGIPGQWLCHQIDTVHWFTGLSHPRSVAVNGGNYVWKDGRENADTFTAVFDYGPFDDLTKGFQVLFKSRQTNSGVLNGEEVKEIYYSNGGTLNLDTNKITAVGGLTEQYASVMGMQANLLPEMSLSDVRVGTAANTGGDPVTMAHVRNWMECVRHRREPNAPVIAGYNHSIAVMMANAAYRTGEKVTFDDQKQEVIAGGKVFKY